jgi:hypothetical protein
MNLELRNIVPVLWTVPNTERARDKESGCPFPPPYEKQNGLQFTIGRKKDSTYNGYNAIMFCNMIRRYINSRNEYCILTFDLNHEQTTAEPPIREVGKTCLPIEVRVSIHGVLCRQVKSNEYEMHAVNNTPTNIDITTSHITKKGAVTKGWHCDFAPNIKLGELLPGSELHISSIYMKCGRVFTDELNEFVNGKMKYVSDNCNFMHNGYTGFCQPEIIDKKTDELKVDPMMTPPTYVDFKIHLQPYIDPMYILTQSLQQNISDIKSIEKHVLNANENIGQKTIDYRSERVRITVINNDLTMTTDGYDESICIVLSANARMLSQPTLTHYTAHRTHHNVKEVMLQLTAPDVLQLLIKTITVTIDQVKELLSTATSN